MRLFASAVVLVSTICSWLVVNVVACEADIFKRTPPDRHHTRVLLPKPVNRTPEPCGLPTPVWMKMEVAKTVHSKNSEVRILKGNYMGNENPVLKVYRSQSDSEMKKEIATEVTNLKQVQHYIAGGFVRTAERKNDVYLLLKNMGVALDPENDKDRAKHEKLKESTRAEYKLKHGMVHMDPYIKNFAHDKDDDSHLKLVDWGCAQYEKVPEYEALEVFYWSLGLPRPPPPRAPIPRLVPVHRPPASGLPTLEKLILRHDAYDFLWANDEASYYKFRLPVEGFPAGLKVQFHGNMRKWQSLFAEISNLKMVDQFIAGGSVEFEGVMLISFLIIKFPGKNANELGLHYGTKERLQTLAIEKYRKEYKMVNTKLSDKYFTYYRIGGSDLMAFIYDWSSARHVDLPSGTLYEFCPP